jgi:hypothetical protein
VRGAPVQQGAERREELKASKQDWETGVFGGRTGA